MKRTLIVVLGLLCASSLDAQVRRRVPRVVTPSTWISASAGLFNANQVSDGATESTWDFGSATSPLYRLAVERSVGRTASVGLTGSYARLPLTYIGNGGAESCARCEARLDLSSLAASFHVGGGVGLHQVLEGSAGVVRFGNLERKDDGSALAPTGGSVDPYFVFGYGFGYSFGPQVQVSVVQDFGLALHEREGLSSEQSNTLRQRTLRLNFRYGIR